MYLASPVGSLSTGDERRGFGRILRECRRHAGPAQGETKSQKDGCG